MKKLLSLIVLIALALQSYSQKNTETPRLTQEQIDQYRNKARWQLTTALIMTGVGTTMMITALALGNNAETDSEVNTVGGLFVTGVMLDLGSLGFSIPSHVNRVRAKRAEMNLSSQRVLGNFRTGGLALKSQPALTLSIPLGR